MRTPLNSIVMKAAQGYEVLRCAQDFGSGLGRPLSASSSTRACALAHHDTKMGNRGFGGPSRAGAPAPQILQVVAEASCARPDRRGRLFPHMHRGAKPRPYTGI